MNDKKKDKRKRGVTGIMRIKNEEMFIESCINSCISALDELIIVYNDCNDRSVDIIEDMRKKYPDKIKVYSYPYKVLGVELTAQDYEVAKKLPLDSPQLLSNYYNFALSKVTCQYAIKIDADQMYFSDVLNEYCDLCRAEYKHFNMFKVVLGILFQGYFSLYRFLSMKIKKITPMMPDWFVCLFSVYYKEFAKWQFLRGKACLSFSGINVLEDDRKLYVCMGLKSDIFNIAPPFNGEGDHVLFKVSDQTYYEPFDMQYYRSLRNTAYALIEIFIHPYRIIPVGFAWLHFNSQRPNFKDKVLEVKKENPWIFVEIERFLTMSYKNVLKQSDSRVFTLFQRVLFNYVYKAHKSELLENIIKTNRWI